MDVDWGRVLGICLGFLLSIPAFFINLLLRFIKLGCGIFYVKNRTFPPKCLVDPSLGDHKYVTVNGVRIHYVEAGEPNKPLMLMVHGFPQFWYSWKHQILHFKEKYRVVAMDMRGYNESGKPSGVQNYFIQTLVDDIKGLVEELGEKKFTLVAHDWGGAVAWTFAALHPEMLTNLVVLNLPHILSFIEARKRWEQALKSWYIVFFQCPILPELNMMSEDMAVFKKVFKGKLGEDEDKIEAYKYAFKDFTTWNRTINYYRMTNTEEFMTFILKNKENFYIDVKTLQIFGTADTALTVAAAKDSAPYLKNGRLELLEGVSHWVQEEEPDRVNMLMAEFLAENQ